MLYLYEYMHTMCLGPGHPMKPHRLALTHSLVLNYGLYRKMEVSPNRLLNYLLQIFSDHKLLDTGVSALPCFKARHDKIPFGRVH